MIKSEIPKGTQLKSGAMEALPESVLLLICSFLSPSEHGRLLFPLSRRFYTTTYQNPKYWNLIIHRYKYNFYIERTSPASEFIVNHAFAIQKVRQFFSRLDQACSGGICEVRFIDGFFAYDSHSLWNYGDFERTEERRRKFRGLSPHATPETVEFFSMQDEIVPRLRFTKLEEDGLQVKPVLRLYSISEMTSVEKDVGHQTLDLSTQRVFMTFGGNTIFVVNLVQTTNTALITCYRTETQFPRSIRRVSSYRSMLSFIDELTTIFSQCASEMEQIRHFSLNHIAIEAYSALQEYHLSRISSERFDDAH